MIELIISTIFFVSPGDSTSIPFDITILFDPPILLESVEVYLDGKIIPGEKNPGYFFSEINNLPRGEHKIKVANGDEIEERAFFLIEKKIDDPLIYSGNLSIGNQNTYFSDTFNTSQNEALLGLDFSAYRNESYLRLSLYHDPEHQIKWYPYVNYLKGKNYIEAGYIYPYFDQLSICSPGGIGLTGKISFGSLSLTPLILYSENYDSLFADYPRFMYGGKLDFEDNFFCMGLTVFYGKDDTTNIINFTFDDPKESTVILGETELKLNEKISLKIEGALSKGSHNLYSDSTTKGSAAEGKLLFESGLNNFKAGIRKISDGYLTLGNAYLYNGRLSGFVNGIYEKGIFSTSFDLLAYKENNSPGWILDQSFKLSTAEYFSPLLEYQWAKYPEYYNEKYWYIGAGFESFLSFIQLENTAGIEKTFYLEETSSFRLLSNISWYYSEHIISLGLYIYRNDENASFDFNLDGTVGLRGFGNVNINYYPYLEKGYEEHLLRIIYEYDF
jgi:hypothetical protein